MKGWKILPEQRAGEIWNESLVGFEDCSPFQTYESGQYHKALGWEPLYYVCTDENEKITAMMLGLLRRFPFRTGFLWCVGGPVGDVRTWNEGLQEKILKTANLKRLYFRFRCDRERNIKDVLFLNKNGWTRSIFQMTSGFSMELDISENSEHLLSRFSGKWRRNLRLAEKNDLIVKPCLNPDIEELRRIFAGMESRKNLPELFSIEKLENLFKISRENLIFYVCEDRSGKLLGFRGALASGNTACDYLAATDETGRAFRVSYLLLWQIILECRRRGIIRYDLGGIDPAANSGVYTFKKETNAREVEFLGEWDWANSSWLRLFGNWLIWKRQSREKNKILSRLKATGKIAASTAGYLKNILPSVPELKYKYKPSQNGDLQK